MTTQDTQQGQPNNQEDLALLQAQITSILQPLFAQLKQDFTSYVDTQLQAIQPQQAPSDEPEISVDENSLEGLQARLKAVTAELQALKDKDADRERTAREARLDSALLELATSNKVLAPNIFRDVLKARLKDSLVEDSEAWFVKSGDSAKTLQAYVSEFLGTEDGKALLPSSNTNGASSTESNSPNLGNAAQSVNDALWQAYGF